MDPHTHPILDTGFWMLDLPPTLSLTAWVHPASSIQ
jgi:hypothetical protein